MPGPDAKIRNYIFAPMMTNVRRPVYISTIPGSHLFHEGRNITGTFITVLRWKNRALHLPWWRVERSKVLFSGSSVNFVFIVEIRIFRKKKYLGFEWGRDDEYMSSWNIILDYSMIIPSFVLKNFSRVSSLLLLLIIIIIKWLIHL